MSESEIKIVVILFVTVYLGIVFGIWYLKFRKTSKRINATINLSSPTPITAYRARYGSNIIMGELYISKDEVRFEKDSTNIFSAPPQNIERVVYNKRSIRFVLKDGQSYVLRYLHPEPKKEKFLWYYVAYSHMYNDPEALKALINELRLINIQVDEGSTGQTLLFYVSVGCAIFAAAFLAFLIIMTTAKLVFGMERFLGINL